MKINIIILLLLNIAGASLGYMYYQSEQKIDGNGYESALASINVLKNTEAEIDSLMLKSRYGLLADYDELAQKSVLLTDTLAELIDSNVSGYQFEAINFNELLGQYREQVIVKSELIENFKSHNAVLRNSIKYAPDLGDQLVKVLEEKESESAQELTALNQALYRWALYSDEEQGKYISTSAGSLMQLAPLFEDEIPLIEYSTHIATVVQEQEQTQSYMANALAVDATSTLEALEDGITSRYVSLVGESNKLWLYALALGLVSLLALIYMAVRLRQSYSGLERKVASRTQEIKTAYADLKNSQEQLVQSEKMASLGQMVAGIAHEINTPLSYVNNNMSSIRGFLGEVSPIMDNLGQAYREAVKPKFDKKQVNDLIVGALKTYRGLERDNVLHETSALLEDSKGGLESMSELVDGLCNFSHSSNQQLEPFDVHLGIDGSLKIAGSVIASNKVEVSCEYGTLPNISAFASKINQVFLNIITNAAQAMSENGGSLKIVTADEGSDVSIKFIDTGIGMDQVVASKIFDPFYTNKPVGEGIGLGLSISYKIIRDHGGDIFVDSSPGQGSTFKVVLPKEQIE